MDKIYSHYWIEQPKDIREHLMKVFGISRSGISEIRDQTLISDGVTNEDLRMITSEKMAEYVGSVEAFSRLWELTIAKARYELNPPIEIPQSVEEELVLIPEVAESLIPKPIEIVENNPGVKPWCDSCDSKARFHKVGCPKKENEQTDQTSS